METQVGLFLINGKYILFWNMIYLFIMQNSQVKIQHLSKGMGTSLPGVTDLMQERVGGIQ